MGRTGPLGVNITAKSLKNARKSLNAAGVVWAKAAEWEIARNYFGAALEMDAAYGPASRNLQQVETALRAQ